MKTLFYGEHKYQLATDVDLDELMGSIVGAVTGTSAKAWVTFSAMGRAQVSILVSPGTHVAIVEPDDEYDLTQPV